MEEHVPASGLAAGMMIIQNSVPGPADSQQQIPVVIALIVGQYFV